MEHIQAQLWLRVTPIARGGEAKSAKRRIDALALELGREPPYGAGALDAPEAVSARRENRPALEQAQTATLNLLEDAQDARAEAEATAKALRNSEATYRCLFDNMLNGFAYCRMLFEAGEPSDFIHLSVNTAFAAQTGLKDVVGRKVSEAVPGIRDTDPQIFDRYGRVARDGQPERFETYVAAMRRWFIISVYSPRPEHFAAVFDDITERKQVELELRHSEEKFRRYFDGSRDALMTIEPPDWRFASANQAAMALFGTGDVADFLAISPWELSPERQADGRLSSEAAPEKIAQALRDGVACFEWEHRRLNGETFAADVPLTRIGEGGQAMILATVRDIAARKAAERELLERNEELERFNRASLGRELDMLEMKRRINPLSRELGREPPYKLEFLKLYEDEGEMP